jgi:spermidine dehydrogenase
MMKTLIPASISGEAGVEGVTRGMINFAALDDVNSSARIRLSSTVSSVQHDGEPAKSSTVSITYEKQSRLYKLKARSAIVAGGSWTAKHILPDLPEAQRAAYAQFYRSPCMMANVAFRNWRFLQKAGITGCRWFEGVGNYFDVTRKSLVGDAEKTLNPDLPIVLSLKVLFPSPGLSTEEQGNKGRLELLSTSFKEYERRIREQFTSMFSAYGFDAQRDIAGIILNRWGHAYVSPQPGFFFGTNGQPAPREVLRSTPHGRIAFANTDLAGAMDHRNSILEAQRAVSQLLDQVLTS